MNEYKASVLGIITLLAMSIGYVLCSENLSRKSKSSIDCVHSANNFNCVKYVRNYDGDTITVDIPGVPPIIGHEVSIRIRGIDTPEIRGKDACEKQVAVQAKEVVQQILSNARNIVLVNVERGKYFRIVADVIADGTSVASVLLSKKLAISYDGGTKPTTDWCN